MMMMMMMRCLLLQMLMRSVVSRGTAQKTIHYVSQCSCMAILPGKTTRNQTRYVICNIWVLKRDEELTWGQANRQRVHCIAAAHGEAHTRCPNEAGNICLVFRMMPKMLRGGIWPTVAAMQLMMRYEWKTTACMVCKNIGIA